MSATNRVAFAGAFAIVGPLVLGMFLVMAVLGLAGLVALLLTGQLDSPGEGWFGVAVLLGVTLASASTRAPRRRVELTI